MSNTSAQQKLFFEDIDFIFFKSTLIYFEKATKNLIEKWIAW